MTDYITRSEWNAREAEGYTYLKPDRLEGVALHWPGHTTRLGKDRIAAALRGWQDYHMDDRGWSDIAYQAAVDQWGRVYELRGLTVQSAANGDQDVNQRFGAVLLIVAAGEFPSLEMCNSVRDVVTDFRRVYPRATKIVPHSAVRPEPTACPGDHVRKALRSGLFTPYYHPPQEETPKMTPEQFAALMKVQNEILTEMRGINARVGYIANEGMQDVDEMRDKIVGTPE
jgi:hypothetical protein